MSPPDHPPAPARADDGFEPEPRPDLPLSPEEADPTTDAPDVERPACRPRGYEPL